MSKRKRNNKQNRGSVQESHPNPPQNNPTRGSAFDTFENQLARLGSSSSNIISAAQYPLTRLTQNYMLLNSLYRNSWICNKIVNIIPEDMMKNGWSITAELKPEDTDRISKLEQRTLMKEKILEGLYWGRLYGGAGAIMIIDGHEDKLEEPLDYDDIMPNSFCGLMVVDRWSGIYPSLELITDHRDPELGMPKYYEVKDNATQRLISKVHHSRVLRFTGKKLPFWEEVAEINWGSSIMEHVYEELVKRDSTSWNIASLVFQANLLVDKVDGMDQMLAASDPEIQRNFYNVKSAQNQMRSNNGMMFIGKDEELTSINYTFAGLSDISETQMLDVSGAADIPMTRLFGRSPAGMNATGESDMQNYYDMVGQQQVTVLKPKLNKLLPVMFMSEFGYIPDDLDTKFNPIATPTEDKVAEIVGKKTDSIVKVFSAGITNQKMSLTELHELSYTTNMFTSITDEDIAKADESFDMGESMAGMNEGFGNEQKGSNSNFNQPSVKMSVADGDFKESEHPRDKNGKFGDKGGEMKVGGSGEGGKEKQIPSSGLTRMSEGQKEKYTEVVKNEPKITADLKDVVTKAGGELAGMEYRLKTPESFDQKIKNKMSEEGMTEREALDTIYDAIRYTSLSKSENLYGNFQETIGFLNKKGYNLIRVRNTWNNDKIPYKGINVVIQDPGGQRFELQFHTRESFNLKQATHKQYEEYRLPKISVARKRELEAEMMALTSNLQKPKDIDKLQNFTQKLARGR